MRCVELCRCTRKNVGGLLLINNDNHRRIIIYEKGRRRKYLRNKYTLEKSHQRGGFFGDGYTLTILSFPHLHSSLVILLTSHHRTNFLFRVTVMSRDLIYHRSWFVFASTNEFIRSTRRVPVPLTLMRFFSVIELRTMRTQEEEDCPCRRTSASHNDYSLIFPFLPF